MGKMWAEGLGVVPEVYGKNFSTTKKLKIGQWAPFAMTSNRQRKGSETVGNKRFQNLFYLARPEGLEPPTFRTGI